jgi:hypothetical protein
MVVDGGLVAMARGSVSVSVARGLAPSGSRLRPVFMPVPTWLRRGRAGMTGG